MTPKHELSKPEFELLDKLFVARINYLRGIHQQRPREEIKNTLRLTEELRELFRQAHAGWLVFE